ncbi:MAG: MarR family winged helix-turn-helix transcriptional regulator [Xanthobacteraceae bacterium]
MAGCHRGVLCCHADGAGLGCRAVISHYDIIKSSNPPGNMEEQDGLKGARELARSRLSQADYSALAEFRFLIRCFLEFSEDEAKRHGLTPRHHQALLVIKGYKGGRPITVGDLAERLRLRHNTAVELANRLAEAGLVERLQDDSDQRRVLLCLTATAERHLAELSGAHLDELSRIKPLLEQVLQRYS